MKSTDKESSLWNNGRTELRDTGCDWSVLVVLKNLFPSFVQIQAKVVVAEDKLYRVLQKRTSPQTDPDAQLFFFTRVPVSKLP